MKYIYLIWVLNESLNTHPLVMTELFRDSYMAGYQNILCGQHDEESLNQSLEPLTMDEVFSDILSAADGLEKSLAEYPFSLNNSLVLCDKDSNAAIAQNAGFSVCLLDLMNHSETSENNMYVNSICALRELLEI